MRQSTHFLLHSKGHGLLSFIRAVPGPERGGERLTFRVCDFLVIRVTNTKYYHFKVDPAFTEK